jgi:hypothetical protein
MEGQVYIHQQQHYAMSTRRNAASVGCNAALKTVLKGGGSYEISW